MQDFTQICPNQWSKVPDTISKTMRNLLFAQNLSVFTIRTMVKVNYHH